ncbi:hypothetical protein POL68_18940 [Stigmatella sp. ncwal1]|uniref:Uncharacterized protein n=1 Tax=Stigmatella ashevillensis TaxID=2995309 RepID=A0ABT5DA69_9BACT|nr:hypothetical protein [Stigmatella ashevillena]MDC0710561.1 hypothetical protein [Stigmatella ashevillena]
MHSTLGLLILAIGTLGSAVVYWWMWLLSFFAGQALGILTERALAKGLLAVGAFAGCTSGLVAGGTALLGSHLLGVRLPKKVQVFLTIWAAWGVFGAIISYFSHEALSAAEAACLLGGCHVLVGGILLGVERGRA